MKSGKSAKAPEVIECAGVAEQMLQTIQIQKKELRRNGEVINRLAQAINETKLMASTTAGGVRGVIGIRADEVLTETPSEPEDDEVIDCTVNEEFEIVDDDDENLCCCPCAELEWVLRRCCEDDARECRPTSKQHNDDAKS